MLCHVRDNPLSKGMSISCHGRCQRVVIGHWNSVPLGNSPVVCLEVGIKLLGLVHSMLFKDIQYDLLLDGRQGTFAFTRTVVGTLIEIPDQAANHGLHLFMRQVFRLRHRAYW